MSRRLLTWPFLVAILLVLVVAASVSVVAPTLDDCAPGVERTGPKDQCVGLSDNFAFAPEFAPAMARIAGENARVQELAEKASAEDQTGQTAVEDSFVTLVYVLPVSTEPSGLTATQGHELEGAFVTQHQANSGNSIRAERPLIKLIVANAGENAEYWSDIVDRIKEYPTAERLIGVLGFDVSRAEADQAVRALAGARFPVITSLITADGFGGMSATERLTPVVRVAPTNSDEAEATVAALGPGPYSVLVVQDLNQADTYATTLGSQFNTSLGPPGGTRTLLRSETYDSTNPSTVPGRLNDVVEELCSSRPDIIYFAGRAKHLEKMLEASPNPRCLDYQMNLWTGDDAVNLPRGPVLPNVTVQYTTLAHPGVWSAAELFSPGLLRGPCDSCFPRIFGYPDDGLSGLEDGGAIIGHDVVLTAVWAIRSFDPRTVSREEVISAFQGLHGSGSVPGASGWISIDPAGNPERKAIPILEPDGNGGVRPRPGPVPAAGGAPYQPPR